MQVTVPWAEPGSRFTALFEALAIDWLQEASFSAVARQLDLSWDEVDGIQGRAVACGLGAQIAAHLGISEKTVRNNITHIFDKLAVENRSQAIVLARNNGFGKS